MAIKTLFAKGTARNVKQNGMTVLQKQRLSRAVTDLQNKSISVLSRMGKVRKLKVQGHDNVYVYRMGLYERVIFSPVDGKNIIHDVINVKTNDSLIK